MRGGNGSLMQQPTNRDTKHYFVDVDPNDLQGNGVGGLDWKQNETVYSISQFFTIPTIVDRATNKSQDPIIDFTKSIMLTIDSYLETIEELHE
jgi:hypothetical protein